MKAEGKGDLPSGSVLYPLNTELPPPPHTIYIDLHLEDLI